MIEELQFLNAVLISKDATLFRKFNISDDHFVAHRDVYDFIRDHKLQYGQIPSMDLILSKFDDFDKVEVDSLDYVAHQLHTNRLQRVLKPMVEKGVELFNQRQFEETLSYFHTETKNIKTAMGANKEYHDWAGNADVRLERFVETANTPADRRGHPTGFDKLDRIFNGGLKDNDLVVVFARLKNGKSWVADRMLLQEFILGGEPCLFTLEMDEYQTGFRLDTMYAKFSNRGLVNGNLEVVSMDAYREYIKSLQEKKRRFHVLTNEHNGKRKWTVDDIRAVVEELNPSVIGVDQLSLMGWGAKFSSPTLAYGHISDQLKTMAMDYHKPVVLLAQAGRQVMNKIREDKNAMPENEDLQWADAIMQYADKGISIRKQSDIVRFKVTANRGGDEGDELCYRWYFDTGVIEDVDVAAVSM